MSKADVLICILIHIPPFLELILLECKNFSKMDSEITLPTNTLYNISIHLSINIPVQASDTSSFTFAHIVALFVLVTMGMFLALWLFLHVFARDDEPSKSIYSGDDSFRSDDNFGRPNRRDRSASTSISEVSVHSDRHVRFHRAETW
ncbi:hypothetical protein AUEXF2481DRAFT_457872 [Aureobasidium subglaciale EXF-2481]|uniref:Uncharacterized protein n=1 Tax=Aureobasidium subglaciale (strain EXF-2481) TaxID=1043005 RepID=A0A074YC40_AURSE|nr:uncharacterized protein AUEXF2481DRAFT_457872 [Aureobasidium subglaciale EXF-2481]KEQ91692.1 hypothetical protein AUEXF2481DRAFT_457872 [Aureobasidium subglaciale EXF-2481]